MFALCDVCNTTGLLDTLSIAQHAVERYRQDEQRRKDEMISAKKKAEEHVGEGGTLLKGSSLPAKVNEVSVKVLAVREAPEGFSSPIILDIEEVYQCQGIPLNLTNMKRLAEIVGDDLEAAQGRTFQFQRITTNNPKTKQKAFGLKLTDEVKSPKARRA